MTTENLSSVSGFLRTDSSGVTTWTGYPDDDTAHQKLCEWLHSLYPDFPFELDPDGASVRGNLGECIAWRIGQIHDFQTSEFECFAVNAISPLKNYSDREIDIVWVFFGQSPADDYAVLQEVKTTTQQTTAYAMEVLKDYDKLFGIDARFNLSTRLQDMWRQLRLIRKRSDLAERLVRLTADSPATCSSIKILPTVIHDSMAGDVSERLQVIRSTLVAKGWPSSAVDSWAIGLSKLQERLRQLATGCH